MNIQKNEKDYSFIAGNLLTAYKTFKDYQETRKSINNRISATIRRHLSCDKGNSTALIPKIFGKEQLSPTSYTKISIEDGKEVKTKTTLTVEEQEALKERYLVMYSSATILDKLENEYKKALKNIVKELPIWKEWAKDIRGVGLSSLGQILAEIKYPLSNYATVAKVWTRMGVGMVQLPNGEWSRQRNFKDKDLAIRAKYVGTRHSILWNLGESLIKQNKDGEFRAIYDYRKKYYGEKCGCYKLVWDEEKRIYKQAVCKHCDDMAKRIMHKEFIKRLWIVWNGRTLIKKPVVPCYPE